jgi:hypothetical protein
MHTRRPPHRAWHEARPAPTGENPGPHGEIFRDLLYVCRKIQDAVLELVLTGPSGMARAAI